MRNQSQKFSTEKRLNIGIIGCGKMGRHHIRAINIQEHAKVVALADPIVEESDISDLISPEVEIYKTPEELFENVNFDVVHIVTPPSTHAELAVLALNNDVHAYIEKPFTLHRKEAEKIFDLAADRGISVCAGHQVLFERPSLITQQSLDVIGTIIHVESYFSFRTVRRNISPVDQLIDILPHPVCLLLALMENACEGDAVIESICTDPGGEVRAILRAGDTYGSLNVTLRGRPVESYVRVIGTNGSLFADFVRGTVIKLPGPGASALSVIYNTYSQPLQALWKATCFFVSTALKKHKSYPGLSEIIKAYYSSIIHHQPLILSPASTISTVSLCEKITHELGRLETKQEDEAKKILEKKESDLPRLFPENGVVLVTGGTGMLGRKVAAELRLKGHPVRILARQIPPFSKQLPGVDYSIADLGGTISEDVFSNVSTIIHCAAETIGGKKDHERNTVLATRNLIESAAMRGITQLVNISSIAVLKPGKDGGDILDESSPVDVDNIARGPYVWGKAKAETEAVQLCRERGVEIKVIRLGPLVDFTSFQAPGRLGKEVGPLFVAVGRKKSKLSLCDVHTAARVIRYYCENFSDSPPTLNLVEPNAPTRRELVILLKKARPDLHCIWLPLFFLKVASPVLKLAQRLLRPGKEAIDLVAVFTTEPYNTDLATDTINRATESVLP
jgi:predicted dehydrogenase/nucleoside-diphosphate-sugar epimerase